MKYFNLSYLFLFISTSVFSSAQAQTHTYPYPDDGDRLGSGFHQAAIPDEFIDALTFGASWCTEGTSVETALAAPIESYRIWTESKVSNCYGLECKSETVTNLVVHFTESLIFSTETLTNAKMSSIAQQRWATSKQDFNSVCGDSFFSKANRGAVLEIIYTLDTGVGTPVTETLTDAGALEKRVNDFYAQNSGNIIGAGAVYKGAPVDSFASPHFDDFRQRIFTQVPTPSDYISMEATPYSAL